MKKNAKAARKAALENYDALVSLTTSQQGENIPGVAHAVYWKGAIHGAHVSQGISGGRAALRPRGLPGAAALI